MSKLKILGWIATIALCGWIGFTTYNYFFNTAYPEFILSGLEEHGVYAGDVACTISGEHPFKVKKLSVFLDGKPLVYNQSISKKSFEFPFSFPTEKLEDGLHTVTVKVVDGTFAGHTTAKEIPIEVDNVPLEVGFVTSNTDFRLFQGKTLHVQFESKKPLAHAFVKINAKKYPCFPEAEGSLVYEAYIPMACEAKPNEYPLTVECRDKVDNLAVLHAKLQIVPFPFKKDNSLRVSAEHLAKEKEMGMSHDKLNEDLKRLAQESPHQKLWDGLFYAPTEIIRISTEFGTIRRTQERGIYAHKGIDIVNTPKSVVWAPQDGIIVLKDRYAFSGNTVAVDHGWGIISLLFHLDSFAEGLEVGKKVKRGNPIGKLGKTGYASGYHLHWEMRVNNTEIDPQEWTKQGF